MKRPEMIGAHKPKRPSTRARRDRLCESAAMINTAYNDWAQRQERSHLAYRPTLNSPRT